MQFLKFPVKSLYKLAAIVKKKDDELADGGCEIFHHVYFETQATFYVACFKMRE
jgi:hypothetical protein